MTRFLSISAAALALGGTLGTASAGIITNSVLGNGHEHVANALVSGPSTAGATYIDITKGILPHQIAAAPIRFGPAVTPPDEPAFSSLIRFVPAPATSSLSVSSSFNDTATEPVRTMRPMAAGPGVPEPASLSLLAIGAASLLVRRRK